MGQTLDDSDWDDDTASTISTNIIELVEDHQSNPRSKWRASD